jgi:hypothetical protein
MNSRTTFFLIVLVALVGGFVVWDHYKGTPTQKAESKRRRILDLDPNDITGIDLVRSNQTIVLAKSGEHWELKQPLAAPADDSAVSSILNELEFAERVRTLGERELQGVSLVDFGLDPPVARVTLHGKRRPVGLLVGRETPTKDALYVQVEGRKEVSVARKSIQERLIPTVDSLRSRTAIDFDPAATTRLEIKTGAHAIELSRAPVSTNTISRWMLTRPLVARADQNKVSELLADLSGLRIQDFIGEDPKDVHTYSLDEPEREVSVFAGDMGKTLLIGKSPTNDPSKVYAKLKSANSIVTVSADVDRKFAAQINDLRDPRVLVFDASLVRSFEILRGADKIAATSTDTDWKLTAPVAVAGDGGAIQQFLRNLADLRATQFVADVATDPDRYGLATPSTTVTLMGEGTNILAQLLVGGFDASNGVQFAKRTDEPFVYGVQPNALEAIPVSYGALRARQVFDLKPSQVTSLVAGGVTVARDSQGSWKLVEPPQGVLDADGLQHLLDALCQLRAEQFGRPRIEADAALGVTIKLSTSDAAHWISVAKDAQAASDTCELTFTIPAPVAQTLTKEIVATPATTTAPAMPASAAP